MLLRIFVLVLLATTANALTPPPLQRVLVPISVDDVAGANNSLWTAELWAMNANGQPVVVGTLPCTLGGPNVPCAPSFDLAPGRTTRIPALGSSNSPGVLLLVPTELASQTTFTLHVRDRNRQSESWGAE